MATVPKAQIHARGLRKTYGLLPVLRGLDLEIEAGSRVGILGPNGAGKSTLLRVISGISRAAGGTLHLFGSECFPARAEAGVLSRLGFVGHEPFVYADLTPKQNLEFFADLYRKKVSCDAAIERFGLGRVAERPARTLSRGQTQRLALARATLHDPEILLLDEPFTGLDPAGRELLEDLLRELGERGTTVLMVSHDLARVSKVATRAIILARGRLVGDQPLGSATVLERLYADAIAAAPRGRGG